MTWSYIPRRTGTVAVKAFSMPTIIRPKTTRGPSQTASSTSTSLLDPAPSVRWPTPESVLILPASAKATDDWNNSVLSDDYSPPEPSMPPPPAPVGVAAPHVIGLATPQAEALYDYSAGHSDDLNFSVRPLYLSLFLSSFHVVNSLTSSWTHR